jgi:hypothetical protein
MERCSSKLFQPLQRLKIGSALAIAASKSFFAAGLDVDLCDFGDHVRYDLS